MLGHHNNMTASISTHELVERIGKPTTAMVDIRPPAAYNGWPLQNEVRGGHIPGAVSCPLAWNTLLKPTAQRNLLETKGVLPKKQVVVYGNDEAEAETAVRNLLRLGYRNVQVYQAGFPAWAAEPHLPVRRLANYDRLVHPAWLNQLIHERQVPGKPSQPFIIAHVTYKSPEEYSHSHIPTAIHLDTNALEESEYKNRRPPNELLAAMKSHGITAETTVILYGRDSNPGIPQKHPRQRAGKLGAIRAAAILMYAGVKDVRLLDGGYDSWLAAGYNAETGWNNPNPITEFGADIPGRPEYIVDIGEARRLLDNPQGMLVSVRSWPEYTGHNSGYRYIGQSGRIAGAVWGNGGSDAYHMQHYRNIDHTMRQYQEIEVNWQDAGITAEKQIAFYCGTGWRASEAFFCAYLLGWKQIAVYDGGWFEWSQDPNNPIEIGMPT